MIAVQTWIHFKGSVGDDLLPFGLHEFAGRTAYFMIFLTQL